MDQGCEVLQVGLRDLPRISAIRAACCLFNIFLVDAKRLEVWHRGHIMRSPSCAVFFSAGCELYMSRGMSATKTSRSWRLPFKPHNEEATRILARFPKQRPKLLRIWGVAGDGHTEGNNGLKNIKADDNVGNLRPAQSH